MVFAGRGPSGSRRAAHRLLKPAVGVACARCCWASRCRQYVRYQDRCSEQSHVVVDSKHEGRFRWHPLRCPGSGDADLAALRYAMCHSIEGGTGWRCSASGGVASADVHLVAAALSSSMPGGLACDRAPPSGRRRPERLRRQGPGALPACGKGRPHRKAHLGACFWGGSEVTMQSCDAGVLIEAGNGRNN